MKTTTRSILFSILMALVAIPASAQRTPRCNVGADPVNANREPSSFEEVIINPADKVITYKSGSGRDVTCNLEAGVPVVINKETGFAVWVYGCGNDIVEPTNWRPKRMPGLQGPPGPQGPKGDPGTSVDQAEFRRYVNAEIRKLDDEWTEDLNKLRLELDPRKKSWFGRHYDELLTVASAVGIGVGMYALLHDKDKHSHERPHREPPPDPKGPGVVTDGSVVTCEATSFPNTCPGSGLPPNVTTGGKRGFGFSFKF